MSISVDESGLAWKGFINQEKAKFPHFGKNWFDNNGEISSDSNYRSWKWEINQYRKDRSTFLRTLSQLEDQIPRPPDSRASQPIVGSKSKKTPISSNSSIEKKTAPHRRGKSRAKDNSAHSTSMPRRTKRSQAWKKNPRRRKSGNKALASIKLPFKAVISVNSKASGTQSGHWHNHLSIAELAGDAIKLYEEFKCCSLKARFIPEDITTGSGLYAACLLDQNGFGDPVQATTTWFPRVADLPGARLCHVTKGCMFTWHPTEPDSRNYRKVIEEKDYKICSFYIFGNSSSLSIKGQLLLTGLFRVRGEYYATEISKRIKELSLLNCDDESFDKVSVD